jgi:hypothetical protein
MKRIDNTQKQQTQALNIPDDGISQMTFEEIFESRLQYFREHQDDFSDNQFKFLKSIQHYKMNIGLTKKQMRAFISTVNSVWCNQNKRRLYNGFQETKEGI